MSVRADLYQLAQSLPEEYGLSQKQAAEIYSEIVQAVNSDEYDEFFDNRDITREEVIEHIRKDLFN